MSTKTYNNREALSLMTAISMLVALVSTCILPTIINVLLGRDMYFMWFYAIGFLVAGIGVVCLMALLRKLLQGTNDTVYGLAVGRVLLTLFVLFGAALFLSLFSGVVAVLLYAVLKTVLTLEQIKGIIDLFVSAVLLLVTPYFIAVFWKALMQKNKFSEVFLESLHIKGKCYLRLLGFVVLMFAVGIVVMTPFHYLPDNIWIALIKTILLGALGTMALAITRNMITRDFA